MPAMPPGATNAAAVHDGLEKIWQWLVGVAERAKLVNAATVTVQRADLEAMGYSVLQAVAFLEQSPGPLTPPATTSPTGATSAAAMQQGLAAFEAQVAQQIAAAEARTKQAIQDVINRMQQTPTGAPPEPTAPPASPK
jgi:hypothetical protein